MSQTSHRVHGLAGDDLEPDWPALTLDELVALSMDYPMLAPPLAISWHSPRPLSAAALVRHGQGTVFVKRHHHSVRSIRSLDTEHRFMHHLRSRGIPIPGLLTDTIGRTAVQAGDWVYEVYQAITGDVYREAFSWSPLDNLQHAHTAGCMLGKLHNASEGFDGHDRGTHILVARSDLILAPDPLKELEKQFPERPALRDYLQERPWRDQLRTALEPWHARAHRGLAGKPTLWTHGDWHVSNLGWSGGGANARITSVFDFGLAAPTFALFDLATAIERNAIAWLALDEPGAAHLDIALALIEGYRQSRPLPASDIALLADLLPIVHVDFALSEVEYFQAITGAPSHADVAYETFLCGHAAWFHTAEGAALLAAIRQFAGIS
ncbi:phosphotransferase enzyme family protein [Pinirhizobacter sp.]|jgi:Ser/Thr protein kinase RdoA (MazF antagonist)|uniref:phosphotransferase enzyme family protein n=1 Tax=Pinirhizobacter sp. TaxID=2950432 RepID=UPI002F3FE4C5